MKNSFTRRLSEKESAGNKSLKGERLQMGENVPNAALKNSVVVDGLLHLSFSLVPRRFSEKGGMAGEQGARGMMVRKHSAKRLADLAFKMADLNIIDSESAFLNGEKTISLALSLVL